MINIGLDDIRTKIDPPINALMSNIPAKDVLNGLTYDDLMTIWTMENTRIMALISQLETFLLTLEAKANLQIDQAVNLAKAFDVRPNGTFGMYTPQSPAATLDPDAIQIININPDNSTLNRAKMEAQVKSVKTDNTATAQSNTKTDKDKVNA